MTTTQKLQDSPLLPVTWWGVLIRIVVGSVAMFAANMARVPFHDWAQRRWPDGDAQLLSTALIFLITPLIIVGGVLAWMRWVERTSISITGLTRYRTMLPGFVGGLALAGLAIILGWIVLAALDQGQAEPPMLDGNDMTQVSTGMLLVFVVVRAVLLQGLPEELIYRGWFFQLTRNRPWLTLVWTTLAFTIIHLTSSGGQQNPMDHLFYLVMPLGMGVLGGAVVLWRGSVWWAVGTHGGLHIWLAVASAAYPLTLGREAWMVLGCTQILVAVVILTLWHRGRVQRDSHSTEF
ncbi:CPBP family intramembrane glutamic endopeptidase [Corynebacterium sp.]|uniref:CPBP family intramembrane glutamic endopeptidase n=1 Tax=Corynebacterium sp. TaxID=1720 RepID=UPI0026DFC211|nr:CPBP family intramembrane glutamic endopeptidase [Corynebacterium sp.]MDO5512675.1 CPBP family intramembrane metalloprotease [Corynebacterium sp.]